MNWYRFTENVQCVPKVIEFGKTHFVMTQVIGKPLYKTFFQYTLQKQFRILDDIITKLDDLHSNTTFITNATIETDFEIEFNSKIMGRLSNIEPLIRKLDLICKTNGIKTINGTVPFDNLNYEMILRECYHAHLSKYIPTTTSNCGTGVEKSKYQLIHGDCQFSNTLYSDESGVSFIDPRGYFGKTFVYGFDGYDFGKVAYALSGYDGFNDQNEMFYLNVDSASVASVASDTSVASVTSNISIAVPSNYESTVSYLSLKTGIPFPDLTAMVCINWLGLAEYFSNNPLKCMGSLVYAHYYFNKYIAK
jgi:hypothetical protein